MPFPLYLWAAWILAVFIGGVGVYLGADALYSIWIRRRMAAVGARHASIEPFTHNPNGHPALLLLHGFADGPSVFSRLAPLLAQAGIAVRALHLSGSGVTPNKMAGTTLSLWRADIDCEIAALRTNTPDRPIWLVGHSLGGTLAFDAALRPENAIAGLVLLAPLVEPSNVRSPILTSRQWFRILDKLLIISNVVESRLPADLHDPEARSTYRTDKFIHRDIYRSLFATIDAVRPRAANWNGPLLVVLAPDDQIVNAAATRQFFAEAVNAAPAELVEQPGVGHVLPLEADHPALAERITQFVRHAPPALTPPPADRVQFPHD